MLGPKCLGSKVSGIRRRVGHIIMNRTFTIVAGVLYSCFFVLGCGYGTMLSVNISQDSDIQGQGPDISIAKFQQMVTD